MAMKWGRILKRFLLYPMCYYFDFKFLTSTQAISYSLVVKRRFKMIAVCEALTNLLVQPYRGNRSTGEDE